MNEITTNVYQQQTGEVYQEQREVFGEDVISAAKAYQPNELAREVQLKLYAALSALVDNPARKRSHLKFLTYTVKGLAEVLDQVYGDLPSDQMPRLSALISEYTAMLDDMP